MNNCGAKITIKARLGIIDQGKLCAFPAKFVKNTNSIHILISDSNF